MKTERPLYDTAVRMLFFGVRDLGLTDDHGAEFGKDLVFLLHVARYTAGLYGMEDTLNKEGKYDIVLAAVECGISGEQHMLYASLYLIRCDGISAA